RDRRVKLWCLEKDASLELAQLATGIDAEIFCQPGTSVLKRCQRVRLASRAVQGDHQLSVGPLPVGVQGNSAFELRNDLAVLAQEEPGVYQGLERGQAVGLQLARRDRGERRVADVGEGGTAPQRKRSGEETRRGGRVTSLESRPTQGGKFTEMKGIHPFWRNVEPVA